MAAGYGHAECVQLLLGDPRTAVNQATTDNGATPLYMAAQKGHTECVRLLVGDPRTAVNQARTDGGFTPLFIAAQEGHAECVNLLLAETQTAALVNTPLSTDLITPLLVAAHSGHTAVVELLLMDDLVDMVHHFPTWRGLVVASLLCNASTTPPFPPRLPVQLWKFIFSFLRPRTDVNAALRMDSTPLTVYAVQAGFVPGGTALGQAAARGRTTCVEHLLANAGIAVHQPNLAGVTPLLAAREGGHLECVTLLESFIAAAAAKKTVSRFLRT
jgi:ankyrin repeat protein